jgi:hypothetical protein
MSTEDGGKVRRRRGMKVKDFKYIYYDAKENVLMLSNWHPLFYDWNCFLKDSGIVYVGEL